jgi:tetratricopeptide (TPR) repeat protein
LLRDHDPQVRQGAARALVFCSERHATLLAICEAMALDKGETADVQRTVGRTLGLLGGADLAQRLGKQLRFWRNSKQLKELLADFYGTALLRHFKPWWRRRSRLYAERRRCLGQAAFISESGKVGATAGLMAGLAWPLTCGVFLAAYVNWIADPWPTVPQSLRWLIFLGATLSTGFALGAWLGRNLGRSLARTVAKTAGESWFRSINRSMGVLFYLPIALAVVAFASDPHWRRSDLIFLAMLIGASWILALLLRLAVAVAAHILRPCFGSAVSLQTTILWAVISGIATITVAILCPLMGTGYLLWRAGRADEYIEFIVIGLSVFLLFSFVLFVALVTLVRVPIPAAILEKPVSAHPKWERIARHRRRLVALTALAAPVIIFFAHGPHSLPFLAQKSPSLGEDAQRWSVPVRLRLWPDIEYFQVRSSREAPAMVEITIPPEMRLIAWNDVATEKTTAVYTPNGRLNFALSNLHATGDETASDLTVRLAPLQLLSPDAPEHILSAGDIQYFIWKIPQKKLSAETAQIAEKEPPNIRTPKTEDEKRPTLDGTGQKSPTPKPMPDKRTLFAPSERDPNSKQSAEERIAWEAKMSGGWPSNLRSNRAKLIVVGFDSSVPLTDAKYVVEPGPGLTPHGELTRSRNRIEMSRDRFVSLTDGNIATSNLPVYRIKREKEQWNADLSIRIDKSATGLEALPLIVALAPYSANDFRIELTGLDLTKNATKDAWKECAELALNGHDLFPADVDLWEEAADVLAKADRVSDLSDRAHQALARPSKTARWYRVTSGALSDCHERSRATEAIREATRLEPTNAQNWERLAWCLMEQGNFGEAVAASKKAMDLSSDFSYRYTHAYSLLKVKRYDESRALARDTLEGLDRPLFLSRLAFALQDEHLESDVLAWARRALELDPIDSDSLDSVVRVLSGFDHLEEALTATQKATERAPKNADILRLQSATLAWNGRYKEALAVAYAAAELKDSDAKIEMNLSWRLQENNKMAEAIEHAENACEMSPSSVTSLNALVAALIAGGEAGKALELTRSEVQAHPGNENYLRLFSWALGRNNQPKEAVKEGRAALEADPDRIDSLTNLAYRLIEDGQSVEAVKVAEHILELEPNTSSGWDTMACALNSAGRFQEAYTWAEKAVNARPHAPYRLSALALAAYHLHYWKQAVDYWNAALLLDPHHFSRLVMPDASNRKKCYEDAQKHAPRP